MGWEPHSPEFIFPLSEFVSSGSVSEGTKDSVGAGRVN